MEAESGRHRVKLGDHVDLLTGFPFQSSEFTDDPRDIRLLRGDNISQGELRWDDAKRWPAERVKELDKFVLREGDVILAMDRPWIEAGLKFAAATKQDIPSLLVQRVARLRAKPGLDQGFLKYVVASREFTDYVIGIQTGTAVPHISGPQIQAFRFPLPPLPIQVSIARVLGSLDSKIELNRRMNVTLEHITQALFKSWFVDFDPVHAKAEGRWKNGESLPGMPGDTWDLWPSEFDESEIGEVPRGWDVRQLVDVADISQGSTPSTGVGGYWDPPEHDWVTVKDLSQAENCVLIRTDRKVSQKGFEFLGSKVVPAKSILLSTGAPIGYVASPTIPLVLGTRVAALQPQSPSCQPYLLEWTRTSVEAFRDAANGTTFPQLLLSTLREFPILVPSVQVLSQFETLLRPMRARVVANVVESASLAGIRDALLPKLLSGQIRVPVGGGT